MPAKKKQRPAPAKKKHTPQKQSARARPVKRKAKAVKRANAPKRTRPVVVPRRELQVLTEASAVQARMMAARAQGLTVGFVPTMGALHAGHAKLMEEARLRADIVVASVFVNPKQFGPREDYAKYPRKTDEDRALCDACGVDVLFAPGADEIYPPGFATTVQAGALGNKLEGAARPGHFDGVLTVVSILFAIVQPHFAIFGEKDFQQLTLVRRLVRDLKMPIEIVAMPVIRDVDGLALSSRNAYLSGPDRQKATCLYRALMAAQDEAQRGVVEAERFVRAARAVLDDVEGADVDYVEVLDPRTLEPTERLATQARLLIAVKLGGVRLLDNGPLFAGVRYP